jgi:hypothetical protein
MACVFRLCGEPNARFAAGSFSVLYPAWTPFLMFAFGTIAVRLHLPRARGSKKIPILHLLKSIFMQLQKALIYSIIFVIFLLGVYEIKSDNVRDFALYKNTSEPIYIVIPGDWLVIGAIGLFLIISHTFNKIKN